MKVQIVTKAQNESKYLVVGVFEELGTDYQDNLVKDYLKNNPRFGKINQTQLLYGLELKILLVGLGKKDLVNYETIQNWAGTAVKTVLDSTPELDLLVPNVDNLNSSEAIEAVTIGAQLAEFNLSKNYKSEPPLQTLKSVRLLVDKSTSEASEGLTKGGILSEAINLARTLGDLPPNEMTPSYFVDQAKKLAKDNKLKIKIIDEKEAVKKGMGAFAAVAKGSDEASFIVILEYTNNQRSKEKWGLVGKGVTFDTGGISIKSSTGMHEMKYDMSGAGSVLATMKAVSDLKLKTNLVGVMLLTENTISGKSYKPGVIVKTYSGKTVEVLDTDAEGRMILIDGLSLAQKDYQATKIIDLATLTGAVIVALGDYYTGVFSNSDELSQQLIATGQQVGERFWRLPLDEIFDPMIKSELADMTNLGHSGSMRGAAGAITGAKFLEAVVEEGVEWAHLDIAGTAWDLKEKPYCFAGATGVGVKTLVRLISNA